MRYRFLLVPLLALIVFTSPGDAARPLPKASVIAVYFYADWCPNCKLLSPMIEEARMKGNFDTNNVLFVTMDLTDKPRIHQSILLAQALGIGDYLKAQGSGTGYLALLDAGSKKEIARMDRTSNAAAIQKTIASALAAK